MKRGPNTHVLAPYHGTLPILRWALVPLLMLFIFTMSRMTSPQLQGPCLLAQALSPARPPAEHRGTERYCWALIGNEAGHLVKEQAAGIGAKVFRLSWRNYVPHANQPSPAYIERKRAELGQLRQAGFAVILNLGLHDTPKWVHENYNDSYYVNQFGTPYRGDTLDSGDANVIFNPTVRTLVAAYIQNVFADFGTDYAAVRLGGGRYGELTYPPAKFGSTQNAYWAFDRNALTQSPTPHWRPGQPSPADEVSRFLTWYLDTLVQFQQWQIMTVRKSYSGPLMLLYPSWGIRPGQIEEAIAVNLDGSSEAEHHGEIQRGLDFARQIVAINDPNVIITTTWLDANASADDDADPRYWSPVKYLASLTQSHSPVLKLFGENTGRGQVVEMERSALQMERYGLLGMAWYREEELFSGQYATLADYERIISGRATIP